MLDWGSVLGTEEKIMVGKDERKAQGVALVCSAALVWSSIIRMESSVFIHQFPLVDTILKTEHTFGLWAVQSLIQTCSTERSKAYSIYMVALARR